MNKKTQEHSKQQAANAAIEYIKSIDILGVGTGSTVDYFIDLLQQHHHSLEAIVSSSKRTTDKLQQLAIPVTDANHVPYLDLYIDGADEYTLHGSLIKGGGGAQTGEKILAQMAKRFICIADSSKQSKFLGQQAEVACEIIPLARSSVARQIVAMGGIPTYREGFCTDHGNCILDISNLNLIEPSTTEKQLNNITGMVSNGIFALRGADTIIIANNNDIQVIDI